MIFFQNPDRQWFKKTISQWVRNKNAMNKYEYLLDHYLQQGVVNVILPVAKVGKVSKGVNIFLRLVRFRIWLLINKLSYKNFNVLFLYYNIKSKDTVFSFFHDNFASTPVCCDNELYIDMIYKAECSFLVHLNHYVYNVEKGSQICSKVHRLSFVAETNLYRHSIYFSERFDWYRRDVLILPFCVQDRFIVKSKVSRTLKAVATGSVTFRLNEATFLEYFGTDLLQPQRKYLLDNSEAVSNLDMSTSEYGSFKNKGLFLSLFLKFKQNIASFIPSYCLDTAKLTNFYDIDLSEHYNSYNFVICPSELIGLPGVGAFEAMACGAVLIDDSNKFYDDYGLYSDEHYICYDGTIGDLKSTLDWLVENPEYVDDLRVKSLDVVNKTMRKESCISTFESHIINVTG